MGYRNEADRAKRGIRLWSKTIDCENKRNEFRKMLAMNWGREHWRDIVVKTLPIVCIEMKRMLQQTEWEKEDWSTKEEEQIDYYLLRGNE